jgi:hypothetical protein
MSLAGVQGIGIGPKVRRGETTDKQAIIVMVQRKRPLAELSPHERIPTELDGFPTDIIEGISHKRGG